MFIKKPNRRGGWTLLEMMIAVTVFSIAGAAVGATYLFGIRSFQAISNYAQLDQQNREAMDLLTREIRQANSVTAYQNGANSYLTLVDGNRVPITYTFNGTTRQFIRTSNGVPRVLLEDCSLLSFNLGMRPPNTNFGYFPTTNVNLAKIVDLTWRTSRELPGGVINSENIQTARIVIRKQKVQQ